MKIRTILVDDEANNNSSLRFLLERYCPNAEIVAVAEDADSAEKIIKEVKPDLIFLDIEMPYGNGFDLLNRLRPVNFAVVFVTAFDSYAIEAIRYSALDYLLKPVNIQELIRAVERVTEQDGNKGLGAKINNLLANLEVPAPGQKKIGLPVQNGMVFEKIEDITYLSASSNYTIMHTANGQKHTIARTLREFEDILPLSLFCRIHHSYIINTNFIKRYFKGRGGYVEMEDGTNIEVSIRKRDEFLARFG